ncbi:MAG: M23 family metallopeptidase [Fibrobacteria bacterium]|nr:M23 family metallopeptidase [Fibrobacteria bacterium]
MKITYITPSGNQKNFSFSKPVLIAIFTIAPLISFIGFYTLIHVFIDGKSATAGYQGQLVKENLELQNTLDTLNKNMSSFSKRYLSLKNKKSQTATLLPLGDLSKKTTSPTRKTITIQPPQNPAGLNKKIDILLYAASELAVYLDHTLDVLGTSPTSIQFAPTGFPVDHDCFIIRHFGYVIDPLTNRNSFHPGIDFSGEKASPIYAVGNGTISKSGSDNFYGKFVRIQHGDGVESFYAHLQKVIVYHGQKIEKGDIIGSLGSSGKTTGPHLHFEISVDGTKLDPLQFYIDYQSVL